MGVMQPELAFAPGERDDAVSAIMTDVGAARERDARASAPLLDDAYLVAAEIGVIREDIGDPAETKPADLLDGRAGGDMEHGTVDAVEMLADLFDDQVYAGEVGLERRSQQVGEDGQVERHRRPVQRRLERRRIAPNQPVEGSI